MNQSKIFRYIIIAGLVILAIALFYFLQNKTEDTSASLENKIVEIPDRVVLVEINPNDTYGKLMEGAGIGRTLSSELYDIALEVYDLAKIRVGRSIKLTYDKNTNILKELSYKIDTEEELIISENDFQTWRAEIKDIEYEIRTVVKEGEVQTSMYAAALENDIDERAIVELANAFQWSIDFSMDARVGDKFKFSYEERYLDGEYVMPGMIFTGRYINAGEKHEVYYFEENEDNKGYFDADGNSVQKMFLKAPVAFKYISSGFTTGRRYIKAFNVSTGHRAIDYAAAYGTPVRSVGNGTVTFAGWNGSYGYMIKIRHNGTYSTNYAHMSKLAVSRGTRVSQGDIIGYVGSTGFSTGPHLHYEMVKNGSKVNPLREVLPPGKPIKEENKERFFEEIKQQQEVLGE